MYLKLCLPIGWKLQREKEKLHKRIIELEKQLDAKQVLELEIERMRGALKVMNHMDEDEDLEARKKMTEIKEKLQEKEEEYTDVEELYKTLIVMERRNNDEVQEARKEVINVCEFFFLSGLSLGLFIELYLCNLDSLSFFLILFSKLSP